MLPLQGDELGVAGRVDTGTATGEATAMTGALLGAPVLCLPEQRFCPIKCLFEKNLVDKEMPDQTLSPGRTMRGFVYYQLPGKRPDANGATFLFMAENGATREKVEP